MKTSYCQDSPLTLFDNLINNHFLSGSVEKQFSGPIMDRSDHIIGKAIVNYFVDTANRRLLKVTKVDSLEHDLSFTVLYYHNNTLLKAERWTESNGNISNYGSYYYGKDKILSSNTTNNHKWDPKNYVQLSREYLSTLIR
jgi:hypothetical protein